MIDRAPATRTRTRDIVIFWALLAIPLVYIGLMLIFGPVEPRPWVAVGCLALFSVTAVLGFRHYPPTRRERVSSAGAGLGMTAVLVGALVLTSLPDELGLVAVSFIVGYPVGAIWSRTLHP